MLFSKPASGKAYERSKQSSESRAQGGKWGETSVLRLAALHCKFLNLQLQFHSLLQSSGVFWRIETFQCLLKRHDAFVAGVFASLFVPPFFCLIAELWREPNREGTDGYAASENDDGQIIDLQGGHLPFCAAPDGKSVRAGQAAWPIVLRQRGPVKEARGPQEAGRERREILRFAQNDMWWLVGLAGRQRAAR
jgi:hypothetical protein